MQLYLFNLSLSQNCKHPFSSSQPNYRAGSLVPGILPQGVHQSISKLASTPLRKLYAGFTPPEKTVCWIHPTWENCMLASDFTSMLASMEKNQSWLLPPWENCMLASPPLKKLYFGFYLKKKTGMLASPPPLIYPHHNLIPFTLGASGVSTCSPRSMTLIWHKIRNFTKCVIMLFVFSLGSKRSGICSK